MMAIGKWRTRKRNREFLGKYYNYSYREIWMCISMNIHREMEFKHINIETLGISENSGIKFLFLFWGIQACKRQLKQKIIHNSSKCYI